MPQCHHVHPFPGTPPPLPSVPAAARGARHGESRVASPSECRQRWRRAFLRGSTCNLRMQSWRDRAVRVSPRRSRSPAQPKSKGYTCVADCQNTSKTKPRLSDGPCRHWRPPQPKTHIQTEKNERSSASPAQGFHKKTLNPNRLQVWVVLGWVVASSYDAPPRDPLGRGASFPNGNPKP